MSVLSVLVVTARFLFRDGMLIPDHVQGSSVVPLCFQESHVGSRFRWANMVAAWANSWGCQPWGSETKRLAPPCGGTQTPRARATKEKGHPGPAGMDIGAAHAKISREDWNLERTISSISCSGWTSSQHWCSGTTTNCRSVPKIHRA